MTNSSNCATNVITIGNARESNAMRRDGEQGLSVWIVASAILFISGPRAGGLSSPQCDVRGTVEASTVCVCESTFASGRPYGLHGEEVGMDFLSIMRCKLLFLPPCIHLLVSMLWDLLTRQFVPAACAVRGGSATAKAHSRDEVCRPEATFIPSTRRALFGDLDCLGRRRCAEARSGIGKQDRRGPRQLLAATEHSGSEVTSGSSTPSKRTRSARGFAEKGLREGRIESNREDVYLPGILRNGGQCESTPNSPQKDELDETRSSFSSSSGYMHQTQPMHRIRPLPPGRDVNFFKPTAFSTWANDVVSISFVRGVKDLHDPFRQSPPLFTHQVFGPQEEIVGYEKPSVQVVYASNTLRPAFSFKHMGVVDSEQLQAAGALVTDVEEVIRRKVPCDYAESVQEVLQDAAQTDFVPVGEEVGSFEAPSCGPGHQSRPDSATDRKTSKFKVYRSDLKDEKSKTFLRRLETLAIWLIERASYIAIDENWELLTLYEVYERDAVEAYQLVGFTTLYRDYRGNKRSSSNSDENSVAVSYRLRISQFVILPPFQRCGHGGRLLRHIYARARQSEDISEVCVENPSERFAMLRDRTDSKVVLELGLLDTLTQDPTPFDKLKRQLKLSRTQLRRLSSSVVRKVVRQSASPGGLCASKGVEYFAGDFVLVRGMSDRPYVAHLIGVNPSTQLLRVRWVYRHEEVPPSVLTFFARHQSSSMYSRKRPCPALEVFYSFHEGFISPQTLIAKCTVLMTPHEPVDAESQLGGLSAFFSRFVYDPAVSAQY